MNKMAAVAKMLGVKLNEEFKLKYHDCNVCVGTYLIDEGGLVQTFEDGSSRYYNSDELVKIINGYYVIV